MADTLSPALSRREREKQITSLISAQGESLLRPNTLSLEGEG